MTPVTVLGASGFIGSHVRKRLHELGIPHRAPLRGEPLPQENLGVIIYCIGLTADFRTKPLETVSAHVSELLSLIREQEFDSLIYLSSTRLYSSRSGVAQEGDSLSINPSNSDDLYNISKAMGESLALSTVQNSVSVRLSNVYGSDKHSQNFLSDIIRSAVRDRKITLRTSGDSEKDYIDVKNVVELLVRMATDGWQEAVYNVASGQNRSNHELAGKIAELTGCKVEYQPGAARVRFPEIDISRIKQEFGFKPCDVLDKMSELVDFYKTDFEDS